ncbi:C45 family autoproteolytic acyltransferase/hydolase [Amycolatopsis albispora]|uniref:Peptidase C45, acyl-coenzyme A-6-aminopenicillanic acid acyl-transferase n=1 Tax=Amycolatopsis albispora TaxID=1804986 RepID=A0A344LBJ6_9PSEU|nr:C45 family peptidase [Amycolatopsis albispora]AXB45420.1 peptidase C45, acyl-coenzyme A - 6-aminopenicillanic acid acyl-transferase [Amycolatopsis albispora]
MSEIVAGGTGEFMTVRHLKLSGTQAEIGRALAEQARDVHGWQPTPADPTIERARRAWFERNWPQHHARLVGAAEVAGVPLDETSVHLDALAGVPTGSGCSATWCATPDGGLLGRNYDFFTVGWAQMFALMSGTEAPEHEPPVAARPYVVTTVPDDGPAVTFVTMNELDSAMDGINEHGLSVVLLIADAENAGAPVPAGPQVGLSPSQLPRFLLDTCENVEQAKSALLDAKQYDLGVPLHYLIADASGRSFVWEHAHGGVEHIVEPDGDALCVTNHFLHRPADASNDGEETMFSHERLDRLSKRTASGPMSPTLLREALDEVRFTAGKAGDYPLRTLWRTVFDLGARTMSAHFYLGDTADGEPRYSPELTFRPAG